jgi:hypothetical protein
MLSFRVDPDEAKALDDAAVRLGVDRSSLLREALHRRLVQLRAETEGDRWEEHPLDDGERSLQAVEAWGPAEDWSDWASADATR